MEKTSKEVENIKKQVENFWKANSEIKKAVDLFNISEEQYIKAIQSMNPQITTSNKITINTLP